MKENFINNDVKLKIGGRKISKLITKKELTKKFEKIGWKDLIEKDIKFADMENFYVGWDGDFMEADEDCNYSRAIKLSPTKKIPYLPVYYCGDWEYPINAVVYFDGKRLRAYTPSYGNFVNLKTKAAFGNDETLEESEEIIQYCKKYGFEFDEYSDFEIAKDIDAMLEDFETRVEIVE